MRAMPADERANGRRARSRRTPTTPARLGAPALLGILAMLGSAADAATAKPKKPVVDVVRGEVVELSCYLVDGKRKGEAHEACARDGIAAGQPVGILRADGTVVLALGRDMKPANEALAPWAARKVRVTGKIVKRAQMAAIVIEKIEEAPPDKGKPKKKSAAR